MSEPTYPPAWALVTNYTDETVIKGVYMSRPEAAASARNMDNVSGIVEYVARPEVDRLIAEAVAAERDRMREKITPLTVLGDMMRESRQ